MTFQPAIDLLSREHGALLQRQETMLGELRDIREQAKSLLEAIQKLEGDAPRAMLSNGASSDPTQKTLKSMIIGELRAATQGTTPRDIADSLTSKGRLTDNTVVSSILSRLRRSNDAAKRDGKWFAGGAPNGAAGH